MKYVKDVGYELSDKQQALFDEMLPSFLEARRVREGYSVSSRERSEEVYVGDLEYKGKRYSLSYEWLWGVKHSHEFGTTNGSLWVLCSHLDLERFGAVWYPCLKEGEL